jgi:prepilin-type N-terminal cleavage/methylation domain-containing protein/prepilin-type processing-associated H-X9-DG protein
MRTRTRGFTLIEMLAVVAILALLVTMLVPSLNLAGRVSRRSACAARLHGVGRALRMYLNESDEVMPVAAAMPSLELTDEPRIVDVLADQLGNPEIMLCPADPQERFFRAEGSSYQYVTMHGGRRGDQAFLTQRFGQAATPVMHDYEPFHGEAGTPGSMNYLFADLHVGDLAD